MRIITLAMLFIAISGLLCGDVAYSDSLLKSAKAGDAEAQYNLGQCYQYGYGIKVNMDEAVRWYQLAADQGVTGAQYELGRYYTIGDKVAKQSTDKTKKDIGLNYKDANVNYSEGVKYFRLAAEKGDAASQYNMGECYYYGKGVEKDASKAVKWYLRAAEQNYAPAEFKLGASYHHGDGVIQDFATAEKWYMISARHGSNDAPVSLAQMYLTDYEVVDNTEASYFWWLIAAARGVRGAATNRDNIGQLLSAPDKEKASKKAAKWLEEANE